MGLMDRGEGGGSCGTAGGCFTEFLLHSSKLYHQEHATEPSRLLVTRGPAAWSAVILRFHGVAGLYVDSLWSQSFVASCCYVST